MAYEIPGFSHTLVAEEALAQFRFVKVSATGGVVYADNGEWGMGVVQNSPASGEGATLVCSGIVMVEAGGSVTAGDAIAADVDGEAITAATADLILGICLSDAAAGEYTSVLLTPGPAASA